MAVLPQNLADVTQLTRTKI